MKALFLTPLSVLFLLGGCSPYESDAIKEFIPGTYVRAAQHEFGIEYDTLVITLQNKSARQHDILRKWRYDRVLDGTPLEPEYKQQKTSGLYNAAKKVLQETETFELFTFDPEKGLLFNGTNRYTKLK